MERTKFFEELQFSDAAYAQSVKEKTEQKLERCKLGVKIAAAAQIAWICAFVFPHMPSILVDIDAIVALGGTIAAYIIGGGLLAALKSTWKIAKTLGVIGWICVPFPFDIMTGLTLTITAMASIPIFFIMLPFVLVYSYYLQLKKDYNGAVEYLGYCAPAR